MGVDDLLDDDRATDGSAPAGGKRPRDRWVLLGVLGVLGLALAVVAGAIIWYGKAASDALDSVNREPALLPASNAPRPDPVTPAPDTTAPVNIVLIGSDSRGDEAGRSDVLQLVHIPGDRSAVYLLSLPRDTWVEIPGWGPAKINAAYAYGGAPLTVQTLEQLLGVPMDHVAIIDFDGFVDVIDALGGVTVTNQHESSSGGHHFPAGQVTLTGESALQFVRERKNLPGGDLDRAERQRAVVTAVVQKLASVGTLSDPGTFREVVINLGPNFTVDEGLTNQAIIDLAWNSREAAGNIRSMQLPTLGTATSDDGQSIILMAEEAVAELTEALRADDLATFHAEHS